MTSELINLSPEVVPVMLFNTRLVSYKWPSSQRFGPHIGMGTETVQKEKNKFSGSRCQVHTLESLQTT